MTLGSPISRSKVTPIMFYDNKIFPLPSQPHRQMLFKWSFRQRHWPHWLHIHEVHNTWQHSPELPSNAVLIADAAFAIHESQDNIHFARAPHRKFSKTPTMATKGFCIIMQDDWIVFAVYCNLFAAVHAFLSMSPVASRRIDFESSRKVKPSLILSHILINRRVPYRYCSSFAINCHSSHTMQIDFANRLIAHCTAFRISAISWISIYVVYSFRGHICIEPWLVSILMAVCSYCTPIGDIICSYRFANFINKDATIDYISFVAFMKVQPKLDFQSNMQ